MLKKITLSLALILTVAAIAMAGASGSSMKKDLTENLILRLENGPYGREHLKHLDEKLMQLGLTPVSMNVSPGTRSPRPHNYGCVAAK